jgi:hypothetical protein
MIKEKSMLWKWQNESYVSELLTLNDVLKVIKKSEFPKVIDIAGVANVKVLFLEQCFAAERKVTL